jgi:hypothetical protein
VNYLDVEGGLSGGAETKWTCPQPIVKRSDGKKFVLTLDGPSCRPFGGPFAGVESLLRRVYAPDGSFRELALPVNGAGSIASDG